MADDIAQAIQIIDELRTELTTAENVVLPQVKGLRDLSRTSISTELSAEVEHQIENRQHRLALIRTVLNALDNVQGSYNALVADGYPVLDSVSIDNILYNELTGELSDLKAGVGVFEQNIALKLEVKLGDISNKSKE